MCACMHALQAGPFSTRNEREREMEAASRRKRWRRRGRSKDSFETKAASPVKAKTGEGGKECMKTTGECVSEKRVKENEKE